ncbi:hypothetical protein POSPLADRAFT_1052816 [Postia placenta MAD-698-R-SB12]|uniref:Uncharacterized protein n=1 Tax=Postia placenta MAD-698-R-SB12 TaxID=670580 RepID=A0A1X6NBX1_9APHY|nr:hypothetical protein POSPLADRAFT_1052816 [Postia placenta MAD-698-R-SB12]OSX66149.1 hypothetical protein POSPLADRAFT_1052816 [Postia placenta MAD-698-R-SB12]
MVPWNTFETMAPAPSISPRILTQTTVLRRALEWHGIAYQFWRRAMIQHFPNLRYIAVAGASSSDTSEHRIPQSPGLENS